jgi:ornithine decarboxylase
MEDAFYVLDLGLLVRLFQGWVQAMPRVRPFYAVKCSPDRALLTTLAALGAGFDCASKAEISQVLDLGVTTDRIVFANPCKMQSHVAYAASVGVNLTTFDSESEVPSSPIPLLPSQTAFSAGCYHSGMFVKPE